MRLALLVVLAGTLVVPTVAHATFPGTNGKIAIERFSGSAAEPFNFQIYTMNADGSAQTDVSNANSYDAGPAWSPNGAKIAFGRGIPRGDVPPNIPVGIFTMNADGSNQTQLTNGTSDGGPSWSQDGTKVAFARCQVIECQIFTVSSDGTNETEITSGYYDTGPSWSPAGTRIAFTRCVVGGFSHGSIAFSECHIDTMNPDGSVPVQITNSTALDFSPDWSPDGKRIAFVRFENNVSQIYTVSADGSDQTRVSVDPSIPDSAPVWSPDGTRIAFARHANGASQIFTMNVNRTNLTNLSNSATYDDGPDWQPLIGPRRSDYKNAAQFCKAERDFLGDRAFTNKYGGGANAHGKCVSSNH